MRVGASLNNYNSTMSVNDKNIPGAGAQGVGVYPGMANPTSSSMPTNPMDANFVRVLPWYSYLTDSVHR